MTARGVRNNNPGNIDYNPRNAWQGQLGLEFGNMGDEGVAGVGGEARGGARHRSGFLRRSGPSRRDATPQTGGGADRTRRAAAQRRSAGGVNM